MLRDVRAMAMRIRGKSAQLTGPQYNVYLALLQASAPLSRAGADRAGCGERIGRSAEVSGTGDGVQYQLVLGGNVDDLKAGPVYARVVGILAPEAFRTDTDFQMPLALP